MSFYYDPFATGKKMSQAQTKKGGFFSHALSTGQDQPSNPKSIPNKIAQLSQESKIRFLSKVKAKISITKAHEQLVQAMIEKCEQLIQGAEKYPEIRENNFLSESHLRQFLTDAKSIFTFLEVRVFRYQIEKFTSEFWTKIIENSVLAIEGFYKVFFLAFSNPRDKKLALFQWLTTPKPNNELIKSISSIFTLTFEFLTRVQKHQEVKPSGTPNRLVGALLDFASLLETQIETYKAPKAGLMSYFTKPDDPQLPLTNMSIDFIVHILEAPRGTSAANGSLKIAKNLFLFLVAHPKEPFSKNNLVRLAKITFSFGDFNKLFAEIVAQPDFNMGSFLEPFKLILTNTKEAMAQLGLYTNLILFIAWVYKNNTFLVNKFPIKPTKSLNNEQTDSQENLFCQNWLGFILNENSNTLATFSDIFNESFYADLVAQTTSFSEIKSFFRQVMVRFWYGLYMLKENHYKINILNQFSKSREFFRLLEKHTVSPGPQDSNHDLSERELSLILLANLLSFDQMILKPDEILTKFAQPKIFFSQLTDVIVAEIYFKKNYYYRHASIEKYKAKQIAQILGFIYAAEQELEIKLPILWPNESIEGLQGDFLQDFFFFFPVKTRFDAFRNLLTDSSMYEDAESYYVTISRLNLVDDAVKMLTQIMNNPHLAKSNIHVRFIDEFGNYEEGNDQGGLFKDLLTELIKTLFNPAYGLMIELEGSRELYINYASRIMFGEQDLSIFQVMGFILAKALQKGITLDVKFAQIFLRKLKLLPSYFQELRFYDVELYNHLRKLKDNPNVDQLELTFTTSGGQFAKNDVELVPGGSQIPVTQNNVIKFVYYLANYKLNEQVRRQFNSFLEGFKTVIDPTLLRIFSSKELQTIIYGTEDEIDIEDLAKHTRYENGFTANDLYIMNLWKIVSEFTTEQKKLLLKFVTNIDRPPIFGFQNLNPKFCVYEVKGDNLEELPRSATCGNVLFLHRYASYDILKSKLLAAITMTSGHYQH